VDSSSIKSALRPAPTSPLQSTDKSGVETSQVKESGTSSNDFALLLDRQFSVPNKATQQELKFSAHAKSRLVSRGIDLNPEDLVKLQQAVDKAGQKGSRESLILSDKGAFVVSVKNNTVITAVDKESLKDNVFTNIDSTVWI